MAYPNGVSVATINVGSAIDFFGEAAIITVTVTPVLGGKAKHIVHAASGHVLYTRKQTLSGSGDGPVAFQVPHVDQPGFLDSNQQATTHWSYSVTVQAGTGKDHTWTKNVQPLVGQDVVDLDLVPDGLITNPTSAPLPELLSVNGRTGAVTVLEATPETIQAGLPGRLAEANMNRAYSLSAAFDVRNYGAKFDGITDDTAAINATAEDAAAFVSENSFGAAASVVMPPGRGRVTGRLGVLWNGVREPVSKVSWLGSGMGVSVLAPEGSGYSVFHRGRWDTIDPITDVTFSDFSIDGSGYTLNNGTYNPEYTKGMFLQDVIRGTWRNLHIYDCGATGLGIDFIPDHTIENVRAERNGRLKLQVGGSYAGLVGASGIGIGTGRYEYETGVIAHCIARDNANHGIFWERQGAATSAYWSKGYKAVACHAEGNRENFSDRGVDGLELVSCTSARGREHGFRNQLGKNFKITGGSSVKDHLGLELDARHGDSVVDNFDIIDAVTFGALFYWEDITGGKHWVRARNLRVSGSGDAGINTNKIDATPLAYLELQDVTSKNNGRRAGTEYAYGVRLFPTFEELRVSGLRCFDDQAVKTQWRGVAANPAALWKKGYLRDSDLTGNSDDTVTTLTKPSTNTPGFEISKVRGYSDKITATQGVIGASPWTRTVGAEPQRINFYNATSVNFSVNGQQITNAATQGGFEVGPGDVITASYTGTAPTLITRYI